MPKPQGMVNDFGHKLSENTRRELEATLRYFKQRTQIELAVVTLPYEELHAQPIAEYSRNLGTSWGVGGGPKKLGLLLLLAIKPPDQSGEYHGETRLEVSRNLEPYITNEAAADIIRKMRDDESAGRFDDAVKSAVNDIIGRLDGKVPISDQN